MTSLVPRWAEDGVRTALADTPVVAVNGARQVGKSTLVSTTRYPGSVDLVTLDDEPARQAAREDPRAFVRRPVDTLVIDEVQLEPTLFRAVKAEVDRDRRPGRFVLTGSSRLLSAPDMADSLVGRVEVIDLWPLSQGEAVGTPPALLDVLFADPRALLRGSDLDRADVLRRICAGGFPEVQGRTPARRATWFDSYVRTTVDRVVRRVSDIDRAAEMPRLLRLCAARTANELNVADVADAMALPSRTVSGYLAHLATAFLVHLLPPWSTNVTARVVKRPKLVLVDSGLAAHLLGATAESLAVPGSAHLGRLVETFAAGEILRIAAATGSRIDVRHFRDRDGAEVDLVLEHPDGRVVGLEVKATSTPRSTDFRGLRLLADRLGDRFAYGAVLCLAPEATPFGDRLAALPLDVLWREVP
ncbi:MAG: ATP-binding protein [Kineosporiaceae bacterium]